MQYTVKNWIKELRPVLRLQPRAEGANEEVNTVKEKTLTEFGRRGELTTIIGKGTVLDGNVKVQNSIRVDGKVTGNIRATDTVVVGKDGVVEGSVHSKDLLLAGRIKGNIVVSGKVVLESKSFIQGDIKASRLVVDDGAQFDGKCSMKEGEGQKSYQKLDENKKENPVLS
jgi:cytoskeletal protein CcmA (bactofilin family)